jgi:hypothetical protein
MSGLPHDTTQSELERVVWWSPNCFLDRPGRHICSLQSLVQQLNEDYIDRDLVLTGISVIVGYSRNQRPAWAADMPTNKPIGGLLRERTTLWGVHAVTEHVTLRARSNRNQADDRLVRWHVCRAASRIC